MKQLFQAYLTWGDAGTQGGHHDLSAYTDEEHLSGNRKRLSKMSGQYAALPKVQQQATQNQNLQLNCNPPSTAVASTSATYSYEASSNIVRLSVEDEDYIDTLANITDEQCNFEPDVESELADDPTAAAAAKVAAKISRAISTPVETADTAPVVPTSEGDLFGPVDINASTLQLPVINCEPPKSENRSGLSGSFRRQSGAHKMTHWTSKKSAGTDAWDTRVESGMKAYEKNSKYTTSHENLPIWPDQMPDGCSFIEMDTAGDAPTMIESFGTGEVRMINSYENQGGGIRRLSSMRSSMRMIEMRDEAALHRPLEPSNSYDAFNSFVNKSADVQSKSYAEEISDLMADAVACDAADEPSILEDILSECVDAAKTYEEMSAQFDNTIEMDKAVISFAPDIQDPSIVEGFVGNFSVTFAESLAVCELADTADHIHEQICFDPKAFSAHMINGEPIEAVCVFDSTEKLSFKASETIRTNLESMFNMNPLSQVEESNSQQSGSEEPAEDSVQIENVTVVSIEDCEVLEIAAIGGKPSRQRAKGTSRSKKTQTRREKRSKKRSAAANA